MCAHARPRESGSLRMSTMVRCAEGGSAAMSRSSWLHTLTHRPVQPDQEAANIGGMHTIHAG